MTTMKRFFFATVAAGAIVVLAAGCDNGNLPSVNQTPNAPTTAPAPAVFTNAVQSAVGNWLGSGYDLRDIGLIIQHFAENQYIGNDQYGGVDHAALDANFQGAYFTDLEDFQVVLRAGT